MIVEQIWTANAGRNFNYLIACRETGEALVGIELGSAAGLDGLLERMRATEMQIEAIAPGSPAYRYLL